MAEGYQTKAQFAASALRSMIRRGELSPGERIDVEAIRSRLGMSATPLREALRLLEPEGLIVSEPHLGMRVADFSKEEASSLYDLRALLEPFATSRAVPLLSERDIVQLDRSAKLHHDALVRSDALAANKHNEALHFRIYKVGAEGSPYLMEFISRLWNAFPWTTAWMVPGRDARSAVDHAEILGAIRGRDAGRAADLMRVHILGGKDSVVRRLEQPGDGGRPLSHRGDLP